MKTILKPSGEDSFLKDAIRDLVVVIVGILAALWLESWWQDQQDQREEQQILTSLRAEFVSNADELEARMQNWIRVRQYAIDELQILGSPVNEDTIAALEEIDERPLTGDQKFFFDPRHGQLTSIISSGKLGLVSNSELRSLIADWPALVADHDFDENLWINAFQDRVAPVRAKYVGPGNFEPDYSGLMQDRLYASAVGGAAGLLTRMIDEGVEVLEVTRIIIDMIDNELGGQ